MSPLRSASLIGRRRRGSADNMATMTKNDAAANACRRNEFRKVLEDRRRELVHDVQGKMRDARTDGIKEREVLDEVESSELDIQDAIEFALIEMKTETLNKIDLALRQLDGDNYGICFECGDEITGARLRALPFAVRCKDCEETRESAEERDRVLARRSSSSLFM
jgi:DnaK suppressor protein